MSKPETVRQVEPRKRRLNRGAASNIVVFALVGVVLIVAGDLVKNQPWTQPEMFKGLGLDLALTITNIGVFLLFVGVIKNLFYEPLKEAMDQRTNELETTFTEAENLKAQMAELRTSYEARLAKTESEAREQIQAQIKEAQALRQTLMAEATVKADDLLRKAEAEIEAEKQKALAEIRSQVVELTLGATEKLLGENVDSATNRKLVDEFISQVAVAG